MNNYFISYNANQIAYEKTVQYLKSVGFIVKKTYESVLDTLYYSIMEKGSLQIKVLEDYDYDDVRIESETLIPEEILKGLTILKHIDY